ncbi:MAG: DNA polymerase III subunit delta [Vulcanibacillus sp.]
MKSSTYLFYGTENYLIQEQINNIIKSLIPIDDRDFNLIYYDLSDTSLEEVINEAEMPPFVSNHKLIIAKNAFFFTGQRNTKDIEHNTKDLELYLDHPAEYSTIIFWVNYEKLDERKRIVKLIKEKGNIKEFLPLSNMVLVEWVKKKAAIESANMSEEAAQLLISIVGQELQLLSLEINKMAIYVGKNGLIDNNVVNLLTSRALEKNIFSLIESVADLKIEKAFQIFYDLLKNKEEPIKILALFARQFRIIMKTKELHRIGYSEKQISSQLILHPYVTKIAVKQSEKFNEEQLRKILMRLAEIDYEIKSGQMDKILAIEMFMFFLRGLMTKK